MKISDGTFSPCDLYDGQGRLRQAIMYTDSSCFVSDSHDDVPNLP